MMRTWDVSNLSAADEQKLGAQLHDVIVGLNPVASDGPWRQRLLHAAEPFLERLTRKEIRYTFEVMDSDEVNAFSHPGGYVYVNRGLFDLIGEDEDYALQFAVGIEIAHVELRHAIKCLQDPDFRVIEGGTIRKLYWLVIPFGYLMTDKVNHDYEADEWTFSRMRRLRTLEARDACLPLQARRIRDQAWFSRRQGQGAFGPRRGVVARYPLPETDRYLGAARTSEKGNEVTSSIAFWTKVA